jgi:hypothetical protein
MATNTVKTSYKVDFLVDNGFTSKIERIKATDLNNAITTAKKAMENYSPEKVWGCWEDLLYRLSGTV